MKTLNVLLNILPLPINKYMEQEMFYLSPFYQGI